MSTDENVLMKSNKHFQEYHEKDRREKEETLNFQERTVRSVSTDVVVLRLSHFKAVAMLKIRVEDS